MTIDIPPALIENVKRQNAVLFLGAGASMDALHPDGKPVPDGSTLRDLLCDRFLGGQLKEKSLKQIADLAISETHLDSVQEFVKELFLPFQPAELHKIIPEIPWHGIATTNYDLIIERAYDKNSSACQRLIPVVSDEIPIETLLKQYANGLTYLKLHG